MEKFSLFGVSCYQNGYNQNFKNKAHCLYDIKQDNRHIRLYKLKNEAY